jgi:transcriptional regulator with XRE-family HTH domain
VWQLQKSSAKQAAHSAILEADNVRRAIGRTENKEYARASSQKFVMVRKKPAVKGDTMTNRNSAGDIAARVGARIRFLRLERGLSVRKFAEIAKCCASNIAHIEMGRSSIQMHVLRKIARALRVEPFDLLNHDPENDDIGYIVEKMRQDPATRRLVKKQMEAWDASIAKHISVPS